MALLGKGNNNTLVFLAALMVMAIVFSSSPTAQGAYGIKDTCTYMQKCNPQKCTSYCQVYGNEGGNCARDSSDQCCCGIRLGHGVGPGPVRK
uniref:Knottin scorpion toxin-like domain-containing protein n=1 Tax=Oryza brachyantha TaxID=4533 RepID=J3NAC5_ORYBR